MLFDLDPKIDPRMRNRRPNAKFMNITKKVILVDSCVSSSSSGVKLIAMRKPRKFAVTLIRPQLIASPTP